MMCCHVSGGQKGREQYYLSSDTILVYNPDTEGWSSAGKMRERRYLHAVATVNIAEVQPYCQ